MVLCGWVWNEENSKEIESHLWGGGVLCGVDAGVW